MTTLPGVRSRRHRLLVGGSWRDAATGATQTLTSPVTGDPVAEVAVAGPEDVDRTVKAAQEAFERHRSHLGSEPIASFKQALSDVMFFLLFQAGELPETRADEDLARRVKELLATLETP